MLAGRVGALPGLIAAGVAIALIAYALWLKRLGPAGNLMIAALSAATFPYGAVANGALGRSWIPAIFALVYHLGRELVKGMEDMEGDRGRNVRTAALRWGPTATGRIAGVCFAIVALIALMPWFWGLYGIGYGIPVVALDLLLLFWIRQLWSQNPPRRLSRRLLIGMALGLLAFCLGEVTLPASSLPAIQEIR